ncbi:MAG TPA: hypothetical protein VHV29_10025 [Terriglobales bacterium]|jgi:hypothetical protein|nr:hypothetical protein [Terriglobales bacterium]
MENDSQSKSRHKLRNQILGVIPAKRAEKLLTEWANRGFPSFNENEEGWKRLFQRYPEMVAGISLEQRLIMGPVVAEYLRKAWDSANDLRRFEWYTWEAQHEHQMRMIQSAQTFVQSRSSYEAALAAEALRDRSILADHDGPPSIITPVEAAIFYLRQNRKLALHCPNPDCQAPYFFRRKKGQKFCSTECAKPSQKESKRIWWANKRSKKGKSQ